MGSLRDGPVTLAVVGLGMAAHTIHLPALQASPRCQIGPVFDIDSHKVADTVDRYIQARPAASLEKICDDPTVDGVIVATPPDSHRDIGLALIRAGKPVLMEKPLAPTYQQSRELVDAASAAGLPLAVGHDKRFHPTLQLVRDLIHRGQIGQPFYIGVHWAADVKLDPAALIPAGYDNYWWRWQDASVGGGIGQDHIPHYVDLFRVWTKSEPRRVWAHHQNIAREMLNWAPQDSVWDDMSLSVVELENGALLRLETGVVGRSISPLLGIGHGLGEWTEYLYILGTEGKLLVDLYPWDSSETGRIALWRLTEATSARRGWTLIEQPEPVRTRGAPAGTAFDTFRGQLDAFLSWLDKPGEGPRELANGEDGAVSVAVVEAAYRSAAAGRWVELKEIWGEATDA